MEGQCDRARALAMLVPLAATASQPAMLMEAAEGTFQPHPHIDNIPCDALKALTAPLQNPGFKPQVISASLGLCERCMGNE